jgi:hypothetical protein
MKQQENKNARYTSLICYKIWAIPLAHMKVLLFLPPNRQIIDRDLRELHSA